METNENAKLPEIRLNELSPGRCAVIRRIETEGDDARRLKTLGICAGRRIEVVKPGDPLIIRIFGSRLGISASLAMGVWLEVCTPDHCAMREEPCA